MSETPAERTSREVANHLEKYCFKYQASIYLNGGNAKDDLAQAKKAKSLIKKDNPDIFIMYFISHFENKKTGDRMPYICFYSWINLTGISARKAQAKDGFIVGGEKHHQPNRKLISQSLVIDQIDGTIKTIRENKIHDLSFYFDDEKFRRYSFLNEKNKPSEAELKAIQDEYREKQKTWYANRLTKPKYLTA